MVAKEATKVKDFDSFYESIYRHEHKKTLTRLMHVIGTLGAVALFIAALATGRVRYVLFGIIHGYGWAWVSHFFVEHNKPATFTYPVWSLKGDFLMLANILTGKEPLRSVA